MWKDFFYYTKSERRAVYALCIGIALLLVAIWLVPDASKSLVAETPTVDSVALKAFEQEVKAQTYVQKEKKPLVAVKSPVVLKSFDPNEADSTELSRLGLSPYVVRNILKYRQKGGRFRTPESFSRIYGLEQEQFDTLKPYIRLAMPKVAEIKEVDTMTVRKVVEKKPFKYPEGTLVDVNSSDTTELKKIPGIGSGIAKAIVAYRSRLGGFYSLEQLTEIEYITPSLVKWFKLEGPVLRPLKVNKAGLEALRAHPYLNFYQAKVIVEHRRKKGQLKSLSQLSLYEEFTEKDLERLSAYLKFD
ncbi:MAG: helix-hairpin-helix domain-containing protein [Bacteroides sp.]|nr:helix-hairpin-helix domain-containing protein [Bacteroides sp.]